MSRSGMLVLVGLVIGLAPWYGSAPATAGDASTVAIGSQIEDFQFKDIRFLSRPLSDLGKKNAYVVVFTTLDCPIVQRYLPRLKELDEQYRDRGVQFVAINVGPGDSLIEAAYQAVKVDTGIVVGKDFDGEAVRALGVTRTPEAVVLDGDRKLRYRGRINSQYRLGGVRPDAGREDLQEAIEDVLAGREVSVPETPVDGCQITFDQLPEPATPVTFAEHVATILQKHCQECHRPGTTAPFSLISYTDAVDHAEMIAEVVREQRMPPLYSSREHGHFINRRELSADERNLVLNWVRGGRAMGDESKLPEPVKFPEEKWRIGTPDLTIAMAKPIKLPADGYVNYQYAFLPHDFKHDTWVEGIEILPSNIRAVHHCNLAYLTPGGGYNDAKFITGYVPGGDAMVLDKGEGFMIPKGAVLVLQLHYITTGEATSDQTSVGLRFCKGRVNRQIKHFQVNDQKFAITPGDPHHRVAAEQTFERAATGIGVFSHMHLRGKDMTYRVHYPNGESETLLVVPNYNFDWQLSYRWAPAQQKFPAGTRIEVVAHFDNSPFNPFNPDPTATVKNGPQTFNEMMYGFVFFTEDDENLQLDIDPSTGHVVGGAAADADAAGASGG